MVRIARKEPHPFDVEVGRRIMMRRRELGLSQAALGQAVGITFQQVQKYENGANRVAASRLFGMAGVLQTSCAWLMGENDAPTGDSLPDLDLSTHQLLKAWRRLDAPQRRTVVKLAEELGAR